MKNKFHQKTRQVLLNTSSKYFKAIFLCTICLIIIFISACKTGKVDKGPQSNVEPEVYSEEFWNELNEPEIYQASREKQINLVHTTLHIKPDWQKSELEGRAILTLTPHFYACDSFDIDAMCFSIDSVEVKNKKQAYPATYSYDEKKIHIRLKETLQKNDTLQITVVYRARPEQCEFSTEGEAITSEKGLFFINPDGKIPGKPRQLWTQGETSNNCRWFPTIEAPNQRMSQDIFLTVEKDITTLSNGILVKTISHSDGTKTDHWKQKSALPPYLTMIAAGNFSVVKETWKGKEVSYYTEPEYSKYAKEIFGNTPEMLSFFSELTGIDYPWEKYAQIAVRDFVSGAMENNTATVHGQDIQRTSRELLDEDGEDVIAHELFHHWFGNLVTCESWSNLPLNESFATYGEYLWKEHKQGQYAADEHRYSDLVNYLNEARYKKETLFRPNYENEDDMFDSHSYAKGSLVLHHLRSYLGDDAFFAGIRLYLTQNRGKSVEIENLRLAFEEISGRDLNFFFNQWFRKKGHPELIYQTVYDSARHELLVQVNQMQDKSSNPPDSLSSREFLDADEIPTFQLPLTLEFYQNGKKNRKEVFVKYPSEVFTFTMDKEPDLVLPDPEWCIPGTRRIENNAQQWVNQFLFSKSFFARFEALKVIKEFPEEELPEKQTECFLSALADPSPSIAGAAITNFNAEKPKNQSVADSIIRIAFNNTNKTIRSVAISTIAAWNLPSEIKLKIAETGLKDSSFQVMTSSLSLLHKTDSIKAFGVCQQLMKEKNSDLLSEVAAILSTMGGKNEAKFFENKLDAEFPTNEFQVLRHYATFLKRQKGQTLDNGISILGNLAQNHTVWFVRAVSVEELKNLQNTMAEIMVKYNTSGKESEKADEEKISQKQLDEIGKVIQMAIQSEKDERLKSYYMR